MNPNLVVCTELMNVLAGHGVETVIISPGSRNTPLVQVASRIETLRKIVITDERTAAFTALGMGMVTRKPVALICTSGTALYNYAPAVAEAFYQKIPLIVITADRPARWINQDDSQTLVQPGALQKIVKRSYDIPVPTFDNPVIETEPHAGNETVWYVNRIANEALITATDGRPGPVHINMQFDNPLGSNEAMPGLDSRIVRNIRNKSGLPPHILRELAVELAAKRVMVVAGFMGSNHELNKALTNFSRLPNVTLMAETISNVHHEGHCYMVDSLLCRLTDAEKEMLRPDIVITIGGALISRMLKEYIRRHPGIRHWTLGDTDVSVDCFRHLDTHIEISPVQFFKGITNMTRYLERKGEIRPASDYREKCSELRNRIFDNNREILRHRPWSELTALYQIFSSMPGDFNLFLSNGTCIRYAQLLIDRLPHGCYCNRGVSGIEGTNATAFGVSLAYNGPTLLVTGDMSFAYCPEVLNLIKLGGDLRIVVINNSGGGIFRFIKTTRDLESREQYFCADPELPVGKIAEAYGWKYHPATDKDRLREALEHLWQEPATIVEVKVDGKESADVLINFMEENK